MTVRRIALHVALPAKTIRDDKQTGPASANVKLHSTRDTRSNLVQSRAGDTRPEPHPQRRRDRTGPVLIFFSFQNMPSSRPAKGAASTQGASRVTGALRARKATMRPRIVPYPISIAVSCR